MTCLKHGAYMQLGTYQRALASFLPPEVFLDAPKVTTLDQEIQYARALLAHLSSTVTPEKALDARLALLDRIRLLSQAQVEMHPGGDATGDFRVDIRVIGDAGHEAKDEEAPA